MPKEPLLLNGFNGGLNQEADLSDVLTTGEGQDELIESLNLFNDFRGKTTAEYNKILSLTGVATFTNITGTGATWTAGTYDLAFGQSASSANGDNIKITVTVNVSGAVTALTIIDGGSGYAVDETVTFVNPGDSGNKVFTVATLNSTALGVTLDSDNDVAADKMLYSDDVLYQQTGIYQIGKDINWTANPDYHSVPPNRGALNLIQTTLLDGTTQLITSGGVGSEENGTDIDIGNKIDEDVILFLSANAKINTTTQKGQLFGSSSRDGTGKLGDTASSIGPDRFIRQGRDNNEDGVANFGEDADFWYDFNNDQHLDPITNVFENDESANIFGVRTGHTAASASLLDFGAYEQLPDATDAETEVAASIVNDIDYFTWTRNGDTFYAANNSPPTENDDLKGLLFRMATTQVSADNDDGREEGPYGSASPDLTGKSLNIELYVTTMANLENIFLIMDTQTENIRFVYDSSSPDSYSKIWKITPTMIIDAGADTGYARITIPYASAIHTGSNFIQSNLTHFVIMPRTIKDENIDDGVEMMRLREMSFSSTESFGWTDRRFKFYSTFISSKGVESLPYEYGSTYGNKTYLGFNYEQEFTVYQGNSTYKEINGKIYYAETDESGLTTTSNKFLICEIDHTNGVKKVGAEEFTPWPSTGTKKVTLNFDDPPVFSTYALESGYPEGASSINALWNSSAVIGRQAYIGNVASEVARATFIGGDNTSTYNALSCRYSVEVDGDPGSGDDWVRFSDYFETTSAPWADYGYFFDSPKRRLANITSCNLTDLGFKAGQLVSLSGFTNPANNGFFKITSIASEGKRGVAAGGSLAAWSFSLPITGLYSSSTLTTPLATFTIEDPRGKSKTFAFYNSGDFSTTGTTGEDDGDGNATIPLASLADLADLQDRLVAAINNQKTLALAANSADYVDVTAAEGADDTTSGTRKTVYITANGTGAVGEYVGNTNNFVVLQTTTKFYYDSTSENTSWKFNNTFLNDASSHSGSDTAENAAAYTETYSVTGGTGKYGTYENNKMLLRKANGTDEAGLADETVSGTNVIEVIGYDSTVDDDATFYNTSLILKSAIGKKAGFPDNLFIDLELGGDEIKYLVSSGDRLFAFSNRKLVIVNVAQDIEFIEATMDHHGINNSKQVCKVGEGVAYINRNGVFFFDGEQVQSLLDGKMTTLEIDVDNCAIGFDANRGILHVWEKATDVYFYSFATQSWIGRTVPGAPFNVEPDTNVVNGKDGYAFFEQGGKTFAIGEMSGPDETARVHEQEMITGRIHCGNIAQNKKFYKVNISLDNGSDPLTDLNGMRLYWRTDESGDTYWTDTADADADSGLWLEDGDGLNEIKLSGARGKWIQLKIKSATSTSTAADAKAPSNMSIGDVSIIYRGRMIK